MITVTFLKNDRQIAGYVCEGHAGYAQEGFDIICSAVSALAVNTANSIEQFTDDPLTVEESEDGGYLKVLLTGEISDQTKLLLASLSLGLKTIEETYGRRYLTVKD